MEAHSSLLTSHFSLRAVLDLMKVSVIIPFYGNLDWLREAIDSVLEQDYAVFEVLVIDDGSPYDLAPIEASYPMVCFIHQPHAGVSAARNNGIAHATGDYLAFLDADDIWLPSKLSLQIPYMQQCEYLWSHTGFLYWNYTNNKVSSRHTDISTEHGDVSMKSMCAFRVATPSVVIARAVFDDHPEIRFDETLSVCEDADLYRQIAQYYPLGLIDRPLVKIRMTGHNTRLQIYKRFLAGEENYVRTREGRGAYAKIPRHSMIRAIYIYYHGAYILLCNISHTTLREYISRLLFAPIFLLERIYQKIQK